MSLLGETGRFDIVPLPPVMEEYDDSDEDTGIIAHDQKGVLAADRLFSAEMERDTAKAILAAIEKSLDFEPGASYSFEQRLSGAMDNREAGNELRMMFGNIKSDQVFRAAMRRYQASIDFGYGENGQPAHEQLARTFLDLGMLYQVHGGMKEEIAKMLDLYTAQLLAMKGRPANKLADELGDTAEGLALLNGLNTDRMEMTIQNLLEMGKARKIGTIAATEVLKSPHNFITGDTWPVWNGQKYVYASEEITEVNLPAGDYGWSGEEVSDWGGFPARPEVAPAL